MSLIQFHNVVDDWYATLQSAITTTNGTSVVLASSGSDGCPSTPFYISLDSEIMRVTTVTADSPSAGQDTLTVERGACGSTAAVHAITALVEHRAVAYQVKELQDRLNAVMALMSDSFGAGDGVVRAGTGLQLKVVQQGTPNMTVSVTAGGGVVSGQPFYLSSASTTAAMVAPSAGTDRIDVVQIDREGTVSIKTGTAAPSPSAPAVDSNNLKLAEILLSEETTSITTSEITDSRVFL